MMGLILKKFSKFLFLLAVLMPAIFLGSCNDKPSDLAVNLLSDTVGIKTLNSADTLLITGKQVYMPAMPVFNSGSVFIGKFNDIKAASLLNFAYLPDTLGNLKAEQIESVELTLFPERYAFGDTIGGVLAFDIFRVTRRWTPLTTTYDSLFVSPANYFSPEKIQSWEGKIVLKDSIDPIKLSLPKEMITDWLKTEMVLDSATNTMKSKLIPNYGLAFIPKENSSVVNRFEAAAPTKTKVSTIVVKYKTEGSDSVYTLNLVSGVDVSYLSTEVPDTSEIVIQNGLNYWTKLDFDLSMIPKYAGIHKAQLELTLDPSRSRKGNVPLDTIIQLSYFINNNPDSSLIYAGSRQTSSNLYIFPSLTSVIQTQNRYSGKFSMVLMPYTLTNQSRELERLIFYGLNNSDPLKRPVLKIIYSVNPAYLESSK